MHEKKYNFFNKLFWIYTQRYRNKILRVCFNLDVSHISQAWYEVILCDNQYDNVTVTVIYFWSALFKNNLYQIVSFVLNICVHVIHFTHYCFVHKDLYFRSVNVFEFRLVWILVESNISNIETKRKWKVYLKLYLSFLAQSFIENTYHFGVHEHCICDNVVTISIR